jgi:glycerate-2-kinase
MNQRQRSLQIGNGVPEPRVFLQQIQNVCEVLVTKYMVVGLLNIVRIVVIIYHNGRVVTVVVDLLVVDRVVTVGVVTDVRGGRLAEFLMNTQILSMLEHFSAQLTSKSRCTAATMSFCVMFE